LREHARQLARRDGLRLSNAALKVLDDILLVAHGVLNARVGLRAGLLTASQPTAQLLGQVRHGLTPADLLHYPHLAARVVSTQPLARTRLAMAYLARN
jgi:hypothetical protein